MLCVITKSAIKSELMRSMITNKHIGERSDALIMFTTQQRCRTILSQLHMHEKRLWISTVLETICWARPIHRLDKRLLKQAKLTVLCRNKARRSTFIVK